MMSRILCNTCLHFELLLDAFLGLDPLECQLGGYLPHSLINLLVQLPGNSLVTHTCIVTCWNYVSIPDISAKDHWHSYSHSLSLFDFQVRFQKHTLLHVGRKLGYLCMKVGTVSICLYTVVGIVLITSSIHHVVMTVTMTTESLLPAVVY